MAAKKKTKKKTTTPKTQRRRARTSKMTAKAAKSRQRRGRGATPKTGSESAAGGATGVLNAAARVLSESKQPMRCREMIDVMLKKSSWSTKGKTPAATLSAAIGREIQSKGADARFRKVERGLYARNV